MPFAIKVLVGLAAGFAVGLLIAGGNAGFLASPARVLATVKLPLLLRPVLIACGRHVIAGVTMGRWLAPFPRILGTFLSAPFLRSHLPASRLPSAMFNLPPLWVLDCQKT